MAQYSILLRSLILSAFLCSVSCSYNPFQKNNHLSGNAAGPIIGGAAGIAGSAALGAPRPLVIGAGIGGAVLGYYLTTLRFAAGPVYKAGGDVYAQGDYAGISIPSYKLFEINTAELLPQAEPILDSAITILRRYPNSNILISGNTAGYGSHHFNQTLSEARARRIAAYLWSHGINNFKNLSSKSRKLTFVGYGDYFPVADTSTSKNTQRNSRIQITAYPSSTDLTPANGYTFTNVGGYEDAPL